MSLRLRPTFKNSGSIRMSFFLSRLQPRPDRLCFSAVKHVCRSGLNYKSAGVDIDAGNELVNRIKKLNPNIGGFSGMVPFGDSFLVAGTDGVGTKLKLAFDLGKHDTIGIDLVAMSVNDIITSGAKPMFFLDYFATGKLDVDVAESVIAGIVEGCRQSDCILLGGETAEMPGFYPSGEYDVAGFAVGSVRKDNLVDGSKIVNGDVLLGLKSTGVHSNGFSLVRKILEMSGTNLHDEVPWGKDTFGDVLLAPTAIYVRDIMHLCGNFNLKGLVHITGGGFFENLPRVVPEGLGCEIETSNWDTLEIFNWIQKVGAIDQAEMFRTFNMGVGMVIIVSAEDAQAVLQCNSKLFVLGKIVNGEGVQLI